MDWIGALGCWAGVNRICGLRGGGGVDGNGWLVCGAGVDWIGGLVWWGWVHFSWRLGVFSTWFARRPGVFSTRFPTRPGADWSFGWLGCGAGVDQIGWLGCGARRVRRSRLVGWAGIDRMGGLRCWAGVVSKVVSGLHA
jgi:hypothetical protein